MRLEAERALSTAMENEYRIKEKVKELHYSVRSEREKKKDLAADLEAADKKVVALSNHIEKLMVALKMHAREKGKGKEKREKLEKQLAKEKRRSRLIREKAALGEQVSGRLEGVFSTSLLCFARFLSATHPHPKQVIVQLKEQTEMLAGQLQLGDERYADLRSKLLIERHNKKQERERMLEMMRERDEREKELMMTREKEKQMYYAMQTGARKMAASASLPAIGGRGEEEYDEGEEEGGDYDYDDDDFEGRGEAALPVPVGWERD